MSYQEYNTSEIENQTGPVGLSGTQGETARPEPSITLERLAPYTTAGIFLDQIGAPLIHYRGSFYLWSGTHYRRTEEGEIRARVYYFLNNAWVNEVVGRSKDNRPLFDRVPFNPDDRAVNKVIDALRSHERVRISSDVQDPAWLPVADPELTSQNRPVDLYACGNGLANLKTDKLLPHTPAFLTLNAVDYDFDPEAKAPCWERFISEILPGDPEAQQTVQEILGYLLSADTSQQKIFLVVGNRRGGKGTISRITEALLGGAANVAAPTLESLKRQFGLCPLVGKKAAIVGDARLEGRGRETPELVERLLSISGEDAIDIEFKHTNERWHRKLGVRFLIFTNPLLDFADASGTIASRFIVIRLRQSFFGREDTELTSKLMAELPGILNWAIVGLRRLRAHGHFVQPSSSAELVEMMEDTASPLRRFAKERCELDPEAVTDCDGTLHQAYRLWCQANEHFPMSKTKFHSALIAALPTIDVKRSGGRDSQRWMAYGVRLIPLEQEKE